MPFRQREGRSMSLSAVLVGPSIEIWRSCWFLGAVIRALRCLPGGCGRFKPCRVGANHCRLRAVGWEQCGHGLNSGPLEVSGPRVLGSLVILFGYPAGSEDALIAGRLHMRNCNIPSLFPNEGKVAELPRGNASGDGSADGGSDGSRQDFS